MDASEPTRGPWLNHERTVLLVVALVAALALGWLALQAHTARYRRSMREKIQANGGRVLSGVCSNPSARELIRPAEPDSSVPWIRWQFGDEHVDEIWFEGPLTDSDRKAIAAFPEAEVVMIHVLPQPAAP
jgi:hypothetical protein